MKVVWTTIITVSYNAFDPKDFFIYFQKPILGHCLDTPSYSYTLE